METITENKSAMSQTFQSSTNSNKRHRSSRRLRHEAEAKVFKNRLGDLETIRLGLGLRASQISEILKVHPSAWTRWVKFGDAPPHVYQMLEWYIELLSWRGQNNPHSGTPVIPQKISKETLESYLPEHEPFMQRTEIVSKLQKKFIERKQLTIILLISFIFQCLLTAGIFLLFK